MEAHEREEGEDLGFLGQHAGDEPAEPLGVGAEIAAGGKIGPAAEIALVEDDVEGGEYLGKPVRQLVGTRDPVGDARIDDLSLGAHDPLRHCCLGDQERVRDLARGHAHDRPKRQRNLGVPGQRRVAAREDEAEPIIGITAHVRRPAVSQQLQLRPVGRVPPQPVDRPPPCRLEEPGSGALGNAVEWPALEGDHHRVLHEVLGQIEVTSDAHQRSADDTHLGAEHGVHRLGGQVARHGAPKPRRTQPAGWLGMSSCSTTGRISTACS